LALQKSKRMHHSFQKNQALVDDDPYEGTKENHALQTYE
jgi:hypothetical protein